MDKWWERTDQKRRVGGLRTILVYGLLNFNVKVLRISTSRFITSHSRVLEKLTVPRLVNKYPAFYGN